MAYPMFVEKIGKRGKERIVVVCDNGSVFVYSWKKGEWSEMSPIPGTEHDREEGRQGTPQRRSPRRG